MRHSLMGVHDEHELLILYHEVQSLMLEDEAGRIRQVGLDELAPHEVGLDELAPHEDETPPQILGLVADEQLTQQEVMVEVES